MLESWERLVKSTSSALSQNKMEHLPLVGQTLLNHQLWRASNNLLKIIIHCKDTHFFRNCKFLRFRTGNPTFAVPNTLARPFGSANSLFPYRIGSLLYRACFRRPAVQKSALCCTSGLGSAVAGSGGVGRVQRLAVDCAKRVPRKLFQCIP